MALTDNSFSKCAPSVSTNIKQTGTVALCSAIPLTTDDLTSVYQKSGDYRVMDALLKADIEIKQCGATTNGLYDFLMANRVNMSKRVVPTGLNNGLLQIAPFIKAKQYSPINNEFWVVKEGSQNGSDWEVVVESPSGIPADVRSFPIGMRVAIVSTGDGGVLVRSYWPVKAVSVANDEVTLTLARTFEAEAEPETGYLRRAANNVTDYEKECQEEPAYMTPKLVPFWVQTGRWSFAKSSKYDQYRRLMLESNPLFREFGDVDEIERNKQLADAWQRRWVNSFFFAKPLAKQTMADYDELEDVEAFDPDDIPELGALGVDGGVCVGKRAEATGVISQLEECERVADLLGGDLNLPALFEAFYDIIRVRDTRGDRNRNIDVFTDSRTAERLNSAMIKYYKSKSEDTLRLTMDAAGYSVSKKADFGFLYRSYPLFFPQGVTMNVITHWAFDDEVSVAETAGVTDAARKLWVLDFTCIYPGIIASNRVVHDTGNLQKLASISKDYACVMKVHTRQQTLYSVTWTNIVECPQGNLIIENFSDAIPSITPVDGLKYPSAPVPYE